MQIYRYYDKYAEKMKNVIEYKYRNAMGVNVLKSMQ